jgi:DNA-binding NtrC family response regulator
MSYHWPGNVRELANVIERSILKTNGPVIKDVDIPGTISAPGVSTAGRFKDYDLPLKEFLKRAEREYLSTLLRRNRGGIATTAEAAMIDAATLHRKMKLHALRREDFKESAKAG